MCVELLHGVDERLVEPFLNLNESKEVLLVCGEVRLCCVGRVVFGGCRHGGDELKVWCVVCDEREGVVCDEFCAQLSWSFLLVCVDSGNFQAPPHHRDAVPLCMVL